MVGPDYQRPDVGLPAGYAEPASDATPVIALQWWSLYRDSVLDDLVRQGLERNADVRLAAARVEESEAALREAQATLLFPLVSGNAGASRARTIQLGTANTFTLGVSTSFEIDLWGRLRRAERSIRDQLLASRYGRDTVGLTLAATIARTYFAARSLDSQLVASEEILRAANESLALAKKRSDAGVASALDVYQATSLSTAAAAQAKDIARQRAAIVHQLGTLTGHMDIAVASKDIGSLPVPPLPPAGLPSLLLERRPDVRQAEMQLAAATERIGVARAAQFPTLSLTGSLGLQSSDLDSLVEKAFRDVSDALSNVRFAADSESDLVARLDAARNALKLAQRRYEQGYSAYLEVLDAQRTLNDAQLAFIRNRQAYLSYTVDLMNSLGGGWVQS